MADIVKLPMRRLADLAKVTLAEMKDNFEMEDDYLAKHRVAFIVLNQPPGMMAFEQGQITTGYTDPKEARAVATWALDNICRQRGIEPPDVWVLEIKLVPPVTN